MFEPYVDSYSSWPLTFLSDSDSPPPTKSYST